MLTAGSGDCVRAALIGGLLLVRIEHGRLLGWAGLIVATANRLPTFTTGGAHTTTNSHLNAFSLVMSRTSLFSGSFILQSIPFEYFRSRTSPGVQFQPPLPTLSQPRFSPVSYIKSGKSISYIPPHRVITHPFQ